MLQKLCHALRDKHPGKKQIILQHSAQCITLLLSAWRRFRRTAGNFYPIHLTAWTLHPCTPIFFSFIKDLTCGQHYVIDKAVQEALWCLWTAEMEFCCTSGMVAKVRQSGGILYRSKYSAQIWVTCFVLVFLPLLYCKINWLMTFSNILCIGLSLCQKCYGLDSIVCMVSILSTTVIIRQIKNMKKSCMELFSQWHAFLRLYCMQCSVSVIISRNRKISYARMSSPEEDSSSEFSKYCWIYYMVSSASTVIAVQIITWR